MRALFQTRIYTLLILLSSSQLFSQPAESALIERMRQYENNILNAYLEYQRLYYEDKSREHELQAFEDLLSVYISQVKEIFETLNLSVSENEIPRDITSRALVFKNLMFLEKAPLNIEYYEKACYEYYQALSLYDGTELAPAIYKDLPKPIQTGDRTYFRLIDLLEDKGEQLNNFGKVKIAFRNFMVTANFDPEMLELIKLQNEDKEPVGYTYLLAESRIKQAFAKVFSSSQEVETYVALPHGTYILRLNSGAKFEHTALTRFYVRRNQEQHYIMEPLADWIILYENPTSKRPDFYKFRRGNKNTDSLATTATMSNGHSNGAAKEKNSKEILDTNHIKLVFEIVSYYFPQYEDRLMLGTNSPEEQAMAVQVIAESIVSYVGSGEYYNRWNNWTASWEIANRVGENLTPGSPVPTSMVELIYQVFREL